MGPTIPTITPSRPAQPRLFWATGDCPVGPGTSSPCGRVQSGAGGGWRLMAAPGRTPDWDIPSECLPLDGEHGHRIHRPRQGAKRPNGPVVPPRAGRRAGTNRRARSQADRGGDRRRIRPASVGRIRRPVSRTNLVGVPARRPGGRAPVGLLGPSGPRSLTMANEPRRHPDVAQEEQPGDGEGQDHDAVRHDVPRRPG